MGIFIQYVMPRAFLLSFWWSKAHQRSFKNKNFFEAFKVTALLSTAYPHTDSLVYCVGMYMIHTDTLFYFSSWLVCFYTHLGHFSFSLRHHHHHQQFILKSLFKTSSVCVSVCLGQRMRQKYMIWYFFFLLSFAFTDKSKIIQHFSVQDYSSVVFQVLSSLTERRETSWTRLWDQRERVYSLLFLYFYFYFSIKKHKIK